MANASLYPLIAAVNGIADLASSTSGRYWSYSSQRRVRPDRGPQRERSPPVVLPVPDLHDRGTPDNVLLPDDYRTSGHLTPISTCSTAGTKPVSAFDFSGHLTAEATDHHRDARRRALRVFNGQLVRRPTELGDIPHHSCSPGSRRTSNLHAEYDDARSPGFR